MANKTAVVWGASGQDSSYLSELLLSKDYKVVGVNRRTSTNNTERLVNCLNNSNFSIVEADLCDSGSVNTVISQYKPDECYNLAAQSHVGTSFIQPSYTFKTNAEGPLYILEAIRNYSPNTKFYQASTSEMFGSNYTQRALWKTDDGNLEVDWNGVYGVTPPDEVHKFQDEKTPLAPNSPYAVAKTAAHNLVRIYRDAYGVFGCCGILFNHESERRGENFVTRKITQYIGRLLTMMDEYRELGNTNPKKMPYLPLKLGNIEAVRDWGYAPDYVEAMWLMLQQDKPDDYIVGTEIGYSVKDFLMEAFESVGLNWEDYVEIDKNLYRPNEVPYLQCRANKARDILGWTPKTSFKELVYKMVQHDVQQCQKRQ